MNILLFILLGSHIPELLYNRIDTAVHYASKLNNTNNTSIDWYLCGGVKDDSSDLPEAVKMNQLLVSVEEPTDNWRYILDSYSKNTAENFIVIERLINTNDANPINITSYSEIYVITSAFHHERAKKIADKIIIGNKFKWILGKAELNDSKYWERVHIKNVELDIFNALNNFQLPVVANL
jgi:hypothetical protein